MCIHSSGVPESMCTLCQRRPGATNQVSRGRQRAPSSIAGQPNRLLVHEFDKSDSRTLLLTPDLQIGWHWRSKVTCFSESSKIDSMADRSVTIQVSLFPRTVKGWSRDWPTPPSLADASSDIHKCGPSHRTPPTWDPIRWSVSRSVLTISVPLIGDDDGFNPDLKWELKDGKPRVHLRAYDLLDVPLPHDPEPWERELGVSAVTVPDVRYELQFLMVASPRPMEVPIDRDWFRRFFPGGLPSLGKRA